MSGVAGDPFEHVRGMLEADVVFGNLECCFASSGTAANKNVVFNADPEAAPFLSPFDVLCLANNHTLDFGPEGLADTMAVLETNGLRFVGAGSNASAAETPLWLDVGGIRVAVVASADASGGDSNRPTVSVLNLRSLADRVREVRADAEVVVASYHGGIELDTVPSPSVVRGLRDLVDAGADVVLAHHPHVLQPAERYRGGVIAYSLGNFVFDNRRYGELADLAATTVLLDIHVPPDGDASYAYIPLRIGDDFKPRPADDGAKQRILDYMRDLEGRLARVDGDAVDTRRLQNMTRELHTKSLKTLVRYGLKHFRDFTFRELMLGAGLALRSLFRRGRRR